MKKIITGIAIILLLLAFTACGNRGKTDGSQSQDMSGESESSGSQGEKIEVTLTQPLLDQYIETLPPFIQKAKDIGENATAIGAAQIGGTELAVLLQSHGWDDPETFAEVNAKVMTLTPWLVASKRMEGQPAEMKEMIAEQFDSLFENAGVSEEEKQLLIANQDKLMKAMEQANM